MSDNGGGFQLDNYVEVHERIKAFYDKHPEGSLRGSYDVREVAGQPFVVYRAEAFRTAEDARPGVGFAWEPFPGKTPYTKDSELMNAETSAWGRAIAALGFEVHKGIASAAEVRNRRGAGEREAIPPSEKQLDLLVRKAKDGGADVSDQENIRAYASKELTGGREGSCSKTIDLLMTKKDSSDEDKAKAGETLAKLAKAANDWTAKTLTDIPGEFEDEPAEAGEPVPF